MESDDYGGDYLTSFDNANRIDNRMVIEQKRIGEMGLFSRLVWNTGLCHIRDLLSAVVLLYSQPYLFLHLVGWLDKA